MSGEKKVGGLRALWKKFNAERRRRLFRWSIRRSHGNLLLLDRSSALDRRIMKTGAWEEQQIGFLQSLVGKHRVQGQRAIFLDVGSYFGLYSLRMRQTGLFDRICAFEANPVNYCHLQASLLLNECVCEIESLNLAVSSSSGYINVGRPDARDRGASPVASGDEASNSSQFRVQAVTLDGFLGDFRDHLVVIKMDIEGHEAHALEGMANLASRNSLILQIEIFRENESVVIPVLKKLNLTKVHEIYPDHWYVTA